MSRRKGRRMLTVAGESKGSHTFLTLRLVKGDRQDVNRLLEKVINRLDKAGFKYLSAVGKKALVSVITMYGQLEVTFVLKSVGRGLSGVIGVSKPAWRTIGSMVVAKGHVHLMTDIGDDVPSMSMKL